MSANPIKGQKSLSWVSVSVCEHAIGDRHEREKERDKESNELNQKRDRNRETLTWLHTNFLIIHTAGAFIHTRGVAVARRFCISTFGHTPVFTAANYQSKSTKCKQLQNLECTVYMMCIYVYKWWYLSQRSGVSVLIWLWELKPEGREEGSENKRQKQESSLYLQDSQEWIFVLTQSMNVVLVETSAELQDHSLLCLLDRNAQNSSGKPVAQLVAYGFNNTKVMGSNPRKHTHLRNVLQVTLKIKLWGKHSLTYMNAL